MRFQTTLAAATAAAFAAAAPAQVIINEVFENPPGSGNVDDVWEYIEIYGEPGMDLTGYAIALAKGGVDVDGDDIPDLASDRYPEIDEAYSLDGLTIGDNGFLVLYNTNDFGISNIPDLLPAETTSADLKLIHIPSTDTPGRLSNDNSSSYILMRRRPNHSVDPDTGESVYADGYAWRKENNLDVDFDGKADCGNEQPVLAGAGDASVMEGYQMVDDLGWSNNGGKEYVRDSEQEISDTPGFNPDALSRLEYFAENPMLGNRFNNDGMIVPTRTADESWIYGEIIAVSGPDALRFNTMLDSEGLIQTKAPTDPSGPTYDGSCNPDDPDVTCDPAPGPFMFDDIDVTGYRVTPGTFNDVDASGEGGAVITQFRFVPGDFNFDGVADTEDFRLICDRIGANFDDTETMTCPDGVNTFDGYIWQGRDFQALLIMTSMADEGAPETVTQEDATAHRVMLGFGEAPDQDGDGIIGSSDLAALLGNWGTDDPISDLDKNGVVGASDLAELLGDWG